MEYWRFGGPCIDDLSTFQAKTDAASRCIHITRAHDNKPPPVFNAPEKQILCAHRHVPRRTVQHSAVADLNTSEQRPVCLPLFEVFDSKLEPYQLFHQVPVFILVVYAVSVMICISIDSSENKLSNVLAIVAHQVVR